MAVVVEEPLRDERGEGERANDGAPPKVQCGIISVPCVEDWRHWRHPGRKGWTTDDDREDESEIELHGGMVPRHGKRECMTKMMTTAMMTRTTVARG